MKPLGIAAVIAAFAVVPVKAQGGAVDPQCLSAATGLADGCQKAIDIFAYMAPQLGTAIAGGSAILGSGASLGGFGHGTIALRLNGVQGSVPQFRANNSPSVTAVTPVASNYNTTNGPIVFPGVDAGLGVFRGVLVGSTRIAALDLIGNALYVPTLRGTFDNIDIVADPSFQIGYGARLGVLRETMVLPAVGVSWIRRSLPTTTVTNYFASSGVTTPHNDTIQVGDINLKATSLRITLTKSLFLFGISAGGGLDQYKASADLSTVVYRNVGATPDQRNASTFAGVSDIRRSSLFANAYINTVLFRVIGEIGVVSGGDIMTYNNFAMAPNVSRVYGAAGLRRVF